MISQLNKEMLTLMRENGADIVGFADLKGIAADDAPYGVVVGIALPQELFLSAQNLPNADYFNEYNRINKMLDNMVIKGAEFLQDKGFTARALTVEAVSANENKRAELPVKTVATRAGLGFIGKNDLLVTKRFGSAVRFSSIVTNAPFECGEPVTESGCGDCNMCSDNCPAKAISGALWEPGIDRDALVDVHKCSAFARKMCSKRIGIEHTICGKCIAICPYTQSCIT